MRSILFLITLLVLTISCETKHTKPISYISFSKVEKAIIKANPSVISVENNDTVRRIPSEKLEGVLNDINASINAGVIKFPYRYKLEVYFKDKSVRKFNITGDIIKEFGDEITQEIRIPNYSDSLWLMGEKN